MSAEIGGGGILGFLLDWPMEGPILTGLTLGGGYGCKKDMAIPCGSTRNGVSHVKILFHSQRPFGLTFQDRKAVLLKTQFQPHRVQASPYLLLVNSSRAGNPTQVHRN